MRNAALLAVLVLLVAACGDGASTPPFGPFAGKDAPKPDAPPETPPVPPPVAPPVPPPPVAEPGTPAVSGGVEAVRREIEALKVAVASLARENEDLRRRLAASPPAGPGPAGGEVPAGALERVLAELAELRARIAELSAKVEAPEFRTE